MPLRPRIVALATVAVLLSAGGTAVALSTADTDSAACTSSPTITRSGSTSEFDIHCSVPNTEVTATVPGPTQTVTSTVTATATATATVTQTVTATPAPAAKTLFGACPTNPGGESATAARSVVDKLGTNAVIRQFHGATLTWVTPPAGSLIWASYKPSTSVTDAQIDALLLAARGNYVTFWHESDNDGLTTAQRAARIALMNRLYDRNTALGHPATIVPIFTGGFFADYGTQANRDLWASVKGDLVGIDADGVHDTTGPTYDITYADETANVMKWLATNPEYTGWAVGEFGTSRQSFDTTGTIRRDWMKAQVEKAFLAAPVKPTVIEWYDFDTAAHNGISSNYNRLNDPSPEITYWRTMVAAN